MASMTEHGMTAGKNYLFNPPMYWIDEREEPNRLYLITEAIFYYDMARDAWRLDFQSVGDVRIIRNLLSIYNDADARVLRDFADHVTSYEAGHPLIYEAPKTIPETSSTYIDEAMF